MSHYNEYTQIFSVWPVVLQVTMVREGRWCRCYLATHRAAQSSFWIHVLKIHFIIYMY